SANDVEFVSNAASTASLEVEAGRTALEKARSPAIRNFAQRMVEQHTKLGMEVRALNVASSVGNVEIMNPRDAGELRRLRELNGREFEREYVEQIALSVHKGVIDAFEERARGARDAQLKTFAQAKLPELQEHLKMAQALADGLGASANRTN